MKFIYGFRCVGADGTRKVVDHRAALCGHAADDPRAENDKEWFLSAFQYDKTFREYLESTGTTKDYSGPAWSEFVWFDVDNKDDPQAALDSARRLASTILYRYKILDDDSLLYFFSGGKGYHIAVPMCWDAEPSTDFNRICRHFAEGLAALAGVKIDLSIYGRNWIIRAPNSRHSKTSLHKVRLTYDELMGLTLERIKTLAASPIPFDWPDRPSFRCEIAAQDWREAAKLVEERAKIQYKPMSGTPRLNRQTLDFIRDGAEKGDRHRLLFSAAANLAEFDCPPALAHALLTESALDCGLSPSDVKRQIECGLAHKGKAS